MSAHDALIVMLPAAAEALPLWTRVVDGAAVQRGTGTGWLTACGLQKLPSDCVVMLVVPMESTALHWVSWPDMPARQGRAAARLAALDASIGSAENLLAVADANAEPARPHIVAVVARSDMQHWLLWAQHHGLDPDVVVPAALLLPEPEDGYHRGVVGGAVILRGEAAALAADDALTAVIVGDAVVAEVPDAVIDANIIAALDAPPINLRQGDFAKRSRVAIDTRQLARMAMWCGFIALVSLVIALIAIVRLNADASRLDAESILLARKVLPSVEDAARAAQDTDAQLTLRGSGGYGFTGPAAGLFTAMQSAPGVAVTLLDQGQDGTLRATLAATRAEDINVVLLALQASGFTITATSSQDPSGRVLADITVRP